MAAPKQQLGNSPAAPADTAAGASSAGKRTTATIRASLNNPKAKGVGYVIVVACGFMGSV